MPRHPSVQHLVDLLTPNSNLPEHLLKISQRFETLRDDLLADIKEDSPEVAAGLRKVLEAKDCFVRAGVMISQQAGEIVHDATNDAPDPAPSAPVAE